MPEDTDTTVLAVDDDTTIDDTTGVTTEEDQTSPATDDTTKTPTQEEYDTLVREREADREKVTALEAENHTLRQPAPVQQAPATKEKEFVFYSPEELTAAVDKGSITDDQKQARLIKQVEVRTEQIVRETMAKERTVGRDTSSIDGYLAVMPDLNNQASDNFKRFSEEWKFQANRGAPDNDTTKLIALRSAFGPLDRLQKTKDASDKAGGPKKGHAEIGGRGDPAAKSDSDPMKGMPKEEKEYYANLVSTGQTTWKEVAEEIKFAKTQTINQPLRMRSVG